MLRSLMFLVLAVGVAGAADSPPPNPFPVLPVQPNDPPPKVDPNADTVLPDEWLLIVKSDADFVLRASPKGKVDIIRATSPTIGGKFVGGSGKFTLTTFKEKNVAIVIKRPDASGQVELIYSPAGAPDDSKDIARMVSLGKAPQPPPVDPDVKPDPTTPFVLKSFRVFIVTPGTTLTAAQNSIVTGRLVEDFLNANCTGGRQGWARADKDAVGEYDPDRQAVWDKIKGEFQPPKNTKTPAIAIQVNDKITIEELATSPAAQIDIFKKRMGGK